MNVQKQAHSWLLSCTMKSGREYSMNTASETTSAKTAHATRATGFFMAQAACGCAARGMAISLTGRFTKAAITPSAIEMTQTMS